METDPSVHRSHARIHSHLQSGIRLFDGLGTYLDLQNQQRSHPSNLLRFCRDVPRVNFLGSVHNRPLSGLHLLVFPEAGTRGGRRGGHSAGEDSPGAVRADRGQAVVEREEQYLYD